MNKTVGAILAGGVLISGVVLTGCGTTSGTTSKGPVTINFYSVGGSDAYLKDVLIPMFEKSTNDKYKVNYARGNWQDVVNKIKSEGKHVDIDVVASGIDGVPAGAKQGVWQQLTPKYSKDIHYNDLTKVAQSYVKRFNGYGVPWQISIGGPAIAYNSKVVHNPPTTYPALKKWIQQHPDKFMYATIPTSGPGRGFYFGLIQSQGENINSSANLSKTYDYLKSIGKNITAYPAHSGDTFKQLNDGSVDIVPHLPGWFAQLYAAGQVPSNIKLAPMTGVKQVLDAQFFVMPKHLDKTHQKAALKFINFAMSSKANAQVYSLFGVPTNKNATVKMLNSGPKATYMKGIGAIPSAYKKGTTLSIPANQWRLFPDSKVLIKDYQEWRKEIQAAK